MNRLTSYNGTAVRWSPWENEFDRVLDTILRPVRWVEETEGDFSLALDVRERAEDFVIAAELPGIKKEDIAVTLENGVLTISAELKNERTEKQGERVIHQERRYGKYARSLRLGTQVNEKSIKASYKDGVLELTLPKAEEVKPKKITVGVE